MDFVSNVVALFGRLGLGCRSNPNGDSVHWFQLVVMSGAIRKNACWGILALAICIPALGENCKIYPAHEPDAVEVAFQKGHHAEAADLLKSDLAKTPNDPDKTALLVRALLWQQKTTEAADALSRALVSHTNSATLLTENAELLYRQGKPWEVRGAIASALKADPCFPRAYLIYSWLLGAESNYASRQRAIQTAHQIDPNDPEIRNVWLNTLPRQARISALEAWIASGTIKDPDELKKRQKWLEVLKKNEAEPHKPCRLASASSTVEIPLLPLLSEVHGELTTSQYALSVQINGHQGLFLLDSGASGVVINKSLAEHASLKPSGAEKIEGIGDEGAQHGSWAYADRIDLGGLEFHDCAVSVLEKDMRQGDGIIGVDVLSRFLVTINYPMHELRLDTLPVRPDEQQAEQPSLATSGSELSVANPDSESGESRSAPPAASPKGANVPHLFDRYVAANMKDWVQVYKVGQYLISPGSIHVPNLSLFLIDTGSWTTEVAPDVAREVTKVDVNTNEHIIGLSGEIKKPYVAEMLDIRFGGISKHELGVPAWPMDRISQSAGMAIAGIIGDDILHELTLHIDYRDGLIKVEYDPKRGYHPPNH